jgi:hypothetical protein
LGSGFGGTAVAAAVVVEVFCLLIVVAERGVCLFLVES